MGTTVTGDLDVEAIATRQEFAEALTAVRERAGLTVREVARTAGVSASTVGGYFSGRHLPPLRPDGGVRAVLRACGVVDPAELDTWQRTLARIRRAPGPRPGGLPAPWVGLRAYGPVDAAGFHGRADEVAALLALVLAGGLVALVGEPGSGKSSLLGAGLVPGLQRSPRPRPVAVLTPGAHPLSALAVALATLGTTDPDDVRALLGRSPAAVRELDLGAGAVIVVDQLEELFTFGADEDERGAFVAALAAASRPAEPATASTPFPPPAGTSVVVTLRSGFLSQAARYPDLLRALRPADPRAGVTSPLVLGAPAPERLRAVVLGPARTVGRDVDEGVVERILADAATAPDPLLPRLSHGLARAWQGQRARLDAADDAGTAGLADSVQDAAEAAYGSLPVAGQRAARSLLVRLHVVTPGGVLRGPAVSGPGQDDAAFGHAAGDAARDEAVLEDPARNDTAWDEAAWEEAVRAFTTAGLLVNDDDGVRAVSGCLPQLWDRLADWLTPPVPEPVGSTGSVGSVGSVVSGSAALAPAAWRPEPAPSAAPALPAPAAVAAGWWAWRWAFVALLLALLVVAGVARELMA